MPRPDLSALVDWRNQFDEQPQPADYTFHDEDCWAVVTAALGNTVNPNLKLNAIKVRRLAGKMEGPGPGNSGDVVRALEQHNIEVKLWRALPTAKWIQMLRKPKSRRVFWVGTDFRAYPELKRCQPNFTGLHALLVPGGYLFEGQGGGDRAVVGNPLCREYQDVTLGKLVESAELYNHDYHGNPKGTVMVAAVMRPVPKADQVDPTKVLELKLQAALEETEEREATLGEIAELATQLNVLASPFAGGGS